MYKNMEYVFNVHHPVKKYFVQIDHDMNDKTANLDQTVSNLNDFRWK